LEAVVKRDDVIQRLLISYIDDDNLWNVGIKSQCESLDIMYHIREIAAGLEKVGYYNEDLKFQNIVRRRSDGELYFIDFGGGLMNGFFCEESLHSRMIKEMNVKDDIYILGKMWQLWMLKHLKAKDELPDDIPDPARSIIYDYCVRCRFNSIEKLRCEYVLGR